MLILTTDGRQLQEQAPTGVGVKRTGFYMSNNSTWNVTMSVYLWVCAMGVWRRLVVRVPFYSISPPHTKPHTKQGVLQDKSTIQPGVCAVVLPDYAV